MLVVILMLSDYKTYEYTSIHSNPKHFAIVAQLYG